MSNNIFSYTSANTIPSKLLCKDYHIKTIRDHNKIYPYHIQINPTNKCPLNCSFCSCHNRDKSLSIPYDSLISITDKFIRLGTGAVTITGGGEPLCYDYLNEYLMFLDRNYVDAGLVTNGILLDKVDYESFGKLKWCRISMSDESPLLKNICTIKNAIDKYKIDWSFSYVIGNNTTVDNLVSVIRFANENNFTHVRIVDDILSRSSISFINIFKAQIKTQVDDAIVIYQGRKKYCHGNSKCYISLLKPNIGPDGNIYPCCGIQYARNVQSLNFDSDYSMGDDIEKIWAEQKYFDGSKCDRCYYEDYNNMLNVMLYAGSVKHGRFI